MMSFRIRPRQHKMVKGGGHMTSVGVAMFGHHYGETASPVKSGAVIENEHTHALREQIRWLQSVWCNNVHELKKKSRLKMLFMTDFSLLFFFFKVKSQIDLIRKNEAEAQVALKRISEDSAKLRFESLQRQKRWFPSQECGWGSNCEAAETLWGIGFFCFFSPRLAVTMTWFGSPVNDKQEAASQQLVSRLGTLRQISTFVQC